MQAKEKRTVEKVMDIKKKLPVYIASSSDALDRHLANWINSHPKKEQMLTFKRETEGRYQYGSKRIRVSQVDGKLTVTCAKKSMPIDYFVENFDQIVQQPSMQSSAHSQQSKEDSGSWQAKFVTGGNENQNNNSDVLDNVQVNSPVDLMPNDSRQDRHWAHPAGQQK